MKARLAALACGAMAAVAGPAAAANVTLDLRNTLPAPITIQPIAGGQCLSRDLAPTTIPPGATAALSLATADLARCTAGLAAASQSVQTVIDGKTYAGVLTVSLQAPAYKNGLPTPLKQVAITTNMAGDIALGTPPVFYVGLFDDVSVGLIATCAQTACPRAVASLTMANDTSKDATISLQPDCVVSEQGNEIPLPQRGYVALNLYAIKNATCFGQVGVVGMTVAGMATKLRFTSDPTQSSVEIVQPSTDGHDLPNRYGAGPGLGLTLFNFWLTCETRACMQQK